MIEITLQTNLGSFEQWIDESVLKAARMAARRSLNVAARSTQTLALKELSARRAMQWKQFGGKKAFRDKNMKLKKAKGGSLASMNSQVIFSAIDFNLIDFVVGSKRPRSQKGVKVTKRRDVRIRVRPGSVFKAKKTFIAKVSGKYKVLKRGDNKLQRQVTPSLSTIMTRARLLNKLIAHGSSRANKEFAQRFNYLLERNSNKLGQAPMKSIK